MSSSQALFKASRVLMAAASKSSTTKPVAASKTASAAPKNASAAPKTATAVEKPKARTKPASSRLNPARPTGILKVSPVSAQLHEFLGVPEASRTDAVKKVWEYIKLNNLQTPTDKRVILCDDKLKTIFEGKDKVGFLEIGKLLSRHFVKTEI